MRTRRAILQDDIDVDMESRAEVDGVFEEAAHQAQRLAKSTLPWAGLIVGFSTGMGLGLITVRLRDKSVSRLGYILGVSGATATLGERFVEERVLGWLGLSEPTTAPDYTAL
jgi:hypothetical protein